MHSCNQLFRQVAADCGSDRMAEWMAMRVYGRGFECSIPEVDPRFARRTIPIFAKEECILAPVGYSLPNPSFNMLPDVEEASFILWSYVAPPLKHACLAGEALPLSALYCSVLVLEVVIAVASLANTIDKH